MKKDFVQYVTLKKALMSGGVNSVDTSCQFREQSAERVVGAVLRTLVEKYGFSRNEFFIHSKQGHIVNDHEEQCPGLVEVKEVIERSNGKLSLDDFANELDIAAGMGMDISRVEHLKEDMNPLYSIHPVWLEHSLKKTLKKLGIETLDCYLLSDPIENGLHLYKSTDRTMRNIKRTFAFLEEKVQDGKIKSYGVHSSLAFLFDPIL